jgi:hypothetical protein
MYMTLLRPIVLYGSETWTLREAEEQRLEVFEIKDNKSTYNRLMTIKEYIIKHKNQFKCRL